MSPRADLSGTVLGGRYRLLRRIGSGGMGEVYEAEQMDLGRRVAVKVLSISSGQSLARLRQEAVTAGSLRSPHVVAVIDFQEPPGQPAFLVMELLEGEPLSNVLVREGRLDPARAARIASQMLAALDAAHRAGLVHRDVKPSNVWLTQTLAGEVTKLLDFGIVKDADAVIQHTTLGAIVGTPSYLAPEQVRGAPSDHRVDIHGVGVVLWEMLVGARLWNHSNLFADILERPAPPVHTIVPNVPLPLSDAVARALAKDRDARFASAGDMLAAIVPFASPTGSGPVPPGPMMVDRAAPPPPMMAAGAAPAPASTSNAALFLVVVAAVVVLGGAAAVALLVSVRGPREAASETPSPAVDAGIAVPVPARPSSTASSAPPPASVAPPPKPTTRQPSPPPAPAPAPAPTATPSSKCVCLANVALGTSQPIYRQVCPSPAPPSCACEATGDIGTRVCATPFTPEGKCGATNDHRASYSRPTSKQGAACEGYKDLGTGKPGLAVKGKLDCDFCYGDARFGAGTHGAPCRGIHHGGDSLAGKWDCNAN